MPDEFVSLPLLLSIKETQSALGLGRTTVNLLIKRRALEAVKVGSRTLITRTSLQALIASLPRI